MVEKPAGSENALIFTASYDAGGDGRCQVIAEQVGVAADTDGAAKAAIEQEHCFEGTHTSVAVSVDLNLNSREGGGVGAFGEGAADV